MYILQDLVSFRRKVVQEHRLIRSVPPFSSQVPPPFNSTSSLPLFSLSLRSLVDRPGVGDPRPLRSGASVQGYLLRRRGDTRREPTMTGRSVGAPTLRGGKRQTSSTSLCFPCRGKSGSLHSSTTPRLQW